MMQMKDAEKCTGVTRGALREYEKKGLIQPGRTESQYRQYTEAEVARIRDIATMSHLGLSLAEIKDVLDDRQTQVLDVLQERLNKLTAIRNHHDRVIQDLVVAMGYLTRRSALPPEERQDGSIAQLLQPILRHNGGEKRQEGTWMDQLSPLESLPPELFPFISQFFKVCHLQEKDPESRLVQHAFRQLLILGVEVILRHRGEIRKLIGCTDKVLAQTFLEKGIDFAKTAAENVDEAGLPFLSFLWEEALPALLALDRKSNGRAELLFGADYYSFLMQAHVAFGNAQGFELQDDPDVEELLDEEEGE